MATITGLTAERMLEIEAASVVDGDVVGNDLILAKHDGSIINAGNVRGPAGPTGPMGSALSVISAAQLFDVGQVGQIRAGRQLTLADFTAMGLSAPIGLWNLSNFNDSSGNARHLTNKGSVPLGVGINGSASTAAVFAGSTAQALYIADTGAADPFRIKTGSLGCWFCSAKRGTDQIMMGKYGVSGQFAWYLGLGGSTNAINAVASTSGADGPLATGRVDVVDDRWHFAVMTIDGTRIVLYVDGALDASGPIAGPMFGSNSPFNIGAIRADGAVAATSPHYGRIDEAFITSDVLSEEQVRNLYCASIPHALGSVPSVVSMSVRRKRRGAVLSSANFPAQPARLYNFVAGVLTDQGSNNQVLVNAGAAPVSVAAPDGTKDGAMAIGLVANAHFVSTDAGLPAALTSRSIGCWFKGIGAAQGLVSWGTYNTGFSQIQISAGGVLGGGNNADVVAGPFVADGQWHFGVVVEDNTAVDGVKRKLYLDGELVGGSTVMGAIVLAGAGRFRIGAQPDGSAQFTGQIDAAFVYAGALTYDQVRKLYDVGSQQLAASPKVAADHIEVIETARLLTVFDTIESSDLVDLAVMA